MKERFTCFFCYIFLRLLPGCWCCHCSITQQQPGCHWVHGHKPSYCQTSLLLSGIAMEEEWVCKWGRVERLENIGNKRKRDVQTALTDREETCQGYRCNMSERGRQMKRESAYLEKSNHLCMWHFKQGAIIKREKKTERFFYSGTGDIYWPCR